MVNIENVTPTRDLVIVKLFNLLEAQKDLIVIEHSDESEIAIRYGEVLSIGPDVTLDEHCPGLEVGDKVIFTEYAGHYIASEDTKNLYKALRGFDIIGKHMKEDDILDKNSTIPTGPRILVEILDFADSKDGIIMNARDPKLADLSYGKVLKVNDTLNKLKLSVGQQVAFVPHVGTFIRNYESEDNKALKMIIEYDILFTL